MMLSNPVVKSALGCLLQALCGLLAMGQAAGTDTPITGSMSQIIFLFSRPLVKDNKILLQWKATGIEKRGFYIVERSIDDKIFEVIGVIKARAMESFFEFLDENPSNTKNYYRIKIPVTDELNIYSRTVIAGMAGNFFCKFYPNPVDKLLMVRSDYSIELKISDATGKTRVHQQFPPGLQIVDVSSLEKSIYVINILQMESNQVITRKLIKN